METASETRKPRKIGRAEWPTIIERRRGGESFASIARAYDCTAPAIRYICDHQDELPSPSPERMDNSAAARTSRNGARADSGEAKRGSPGRGKRPSPNLGLTPEMRDAITFEVSRLLVRLDAEIEHPSGVARDNLREAIDGLMRAAARIRILLEQPA